MAGFTYLFSNQKHDKIEDMSHFKDEIIEGKHHLYYHGLRKFHNDCIFSKTEKGIMVLDGVITNNRELMDALGESDWETCLWNMYKNDPVFFKQLRGSFVGCIIDFNTDKNICFVDHFGSKPLFYFKQGEAFIVSTDIVSILKSPSYDLTQFDLNIKGVYMLLSYGFCIDGHTIYENIQKLQSGDQIIWSADSWSLEAYHRFVYSNKHEKSEEQYLKEVHDSFNVAVTRNFSKDEEYGYKHFVGLSGGLDSRLTSMVAHRLGYTSQTNFTFSQSGYLDQTIACEIASDLSHEWIFRFLDNCNYLKNIDEIIYLTGGSALYYGGALSYTFFKDINFKDFGLIHTGQQGDIVIGSYIKVLNPERLNSLGGAYNSRFLKLLGEDRSFDSFEELEAVFNRQRGYNGTNTGLIPANHFSETLSPFLDVDFMEVCAKVPLSLRFNHKLYKKLITKYYPEILNYKWESTGSKINEPIFFHYKGIPVTVSKIKKTLNRIMVNTGLKQPGNQLMNPMQYWYENNAELKSFIHQYFKDNIQHVHDPKLNSLCVELFQSGDAVGKNQVLTILAAAKLMHTIKTSS